MLIVNYGFDSRWKIWQTSIFLDNKNSVRADLIQTSDYTNISDLFYS